MRWGGKLHYMSKMKNSYQHVNARLIDSLAFITTNKHYRLILSYQALFLKYDF